MKKSDLYEIAIKILGIYQFYTIIGPVTDLFRVYAFLSQEYRDPELGSSNDTEFYLLSFAHLLLSLGFASLLTFRTQAITRLICRPADDEPVNLTTDRKTIYEMALVIMGLLLIVWALPDFFFELKRRIELVQNALLIDENNVNYLLRSGIKIALGLVATIYARPISALFVQDGKRDQE